jgi:hypothetical protein
MARSGWRLVLLMAVAAVLVACASPITQRPQPAPTHPTPAKATLAAIPLQPAAPCTGAFIPHDLPFANGARMREMRTYASNGSGLAIADLDADTDLDLIFASIDGRSAVLWNEENLKFTKQELDDVNTRAASTVDIDGDSRPDLVFTHRTGGVSYWRNLGNRTFEPSTLPNVDAFAYALAWGDLNGDGQLDLVTASYHEELARDGANANAIAERAGVFYYERAGKGFVPHRLAPSAQALSVGLVDVNRDGKTDIWIANDFVEQDDIWLRQSSAWVKAKPFEVTSHSTMSIDWADLDNNGGLALFTTDMNPYDISIANMARWLPMTAATQEHHAWGDPQIMQNVLLVQDQNGAWRNQAPQRGIDASGWSWAGRFGDLDNDGWLDLYVVNGMIAKDLFGHLQNDELAEENRAFRNTGNGTFALAHEWQLNATASGRGMAMADLDSDGDLDIVVNNLRGSSQVFENRLCGGYSLQVELRWPSSGNVNAVGAWVELHTSHGTLRRDVRATSGYLTGDAPRLHFGFRPAAVLQQLVVHWPDGATTRVESPQPNHLLTVMR